METQPPPIPRRPGGARPIPSRAGASAPPPPKLAIPIGNVRMNVDQANEGGWQQPPASLPSLALNPRRPTTAPSAPGRPKLTLAGVASSSASLSIVPVSRPPLLNAPSAPAAIRTSTPALKLSIPGVGGTPSGFSSGHDYPSDFDDPDNLHSALKTPTPLNGVEDTNPTLQARGRDYEGDGESSYGYGRLGNGLGEGNGNSMSAMTEDIRQALTRSRFEPSPSMSISALPGNRSRAGSIVTRSRANSSVSGSRRNSNTNPDDILHFRSLDISGVGAQAGGSRRSSLEGHRAGSSFGHGMEDDGELMSDVNPDDLVFVQRLGEGTGGSVDLVKEPRTGRIMAKKVIARTANPSMHKQLLRELEILNACSSPYIVKHYGSFLAERDSVIGILMEYCEAGSLDGLVQKMRKTGMRCSEHVLGRIASSVLKGLDYLHERRIIHRDIKPSNIVLTRQGVVKLCDFGVSGELVDSIAGTFTGTSFYMAPERIQNQQYSIKADVWSLGMTLHEVAHLRFPFPPEGETQSVAPIELLSYIVTAPVPLMTDDPSVGRVWSDPIKDFMAACLIRSGTDRPYPWQLLQHPFIKASDAKKINMAKWVAMLCGWPAP